MFVLNFVYIDTPCVVGWCTGSIQLPFLGWELSQMMVGQIVFWFVWVDGANVVFVQEFDPTEVAVK